MPVLATKLRRPSTPLLLIARPRLLDQLTTYVDRRLILVSAPAGYGKTALISNWLEAAGSAYATGPRVGDQRAAPACAG